MRLHKLQTLAIHLPEILSALLQRLTLQVKLPQDQLVIYGILGMDKKAIEQIQESFSMQVLTVLN